MRYVEAAGLRLSAVGLGAWQFGSREWGYGSGYAASIAPDIVHRSLDLGINLVDTAEMYGFGRSERIVGQALTGRREEAFVATKLFPILPVGPVIENRARASARRLGVGTIDLYQAHWPNPVLPPRSMMPAFGRLQREGVVRHVGVSNFSRAQWEEAESALGAPVVTNQVRYSLVDRRIEREVLPWAQAHDRIVIAYSPLGQGLLSGRYDEDHRPAGFRSSTALFLPENLRRAQPLLDVLRQVAGAHDASCAQVALAWLIRRPNVVVIPGASSVAQAESNAAAADLVLTDEEDAALTAASDAFTPIAGTAAVPKIVEDRAAGAVNRVRRVMEGLRS